MRPINVEITMGHDIGLSDFLLQTYRTGGSRGPFESRAITYNIWRTSCSAKEGRRTQRKK